MEIMSYIKFTLNVTKTWLLARHLDKDMQLLETF